MALKVQDQSQEVMKMSREWPIVEALLGGTTAMRDMGVRFLPQWPNEDDKAYENRRCTATLLPIFRRTLSVMVGKPFSKQLMLQEDVPARIEEWAQDIDRQGNSLHTFASWLTAEALSYGLCGVLVDYPGVNADEVRTVAQEQAEQVRPYFVLIRHWQILGWKTETRDGKIRLTQLRLLEIADAPDGEYGVKAVKRVRVLTPGNWQLFEEPPNGAGDWLEVGSGVTTLKEIPFVPFYGWKHGYMCGVSPLLDLAYLNVKHWQSQSDQDTLMHVARVPILTVRDVGEKFSFTVGAAAAINLGDGPNAGMNYVEHSGAAIGAGETSLEKLEQQAIQSGAELLMVKPGEQKSATQSNNEAEANKCDLQRIVESIEDSLDQCLQFMAEWVGEPDGGHVSLFKDFAAGSLTDASAQLIATMQSQGLISKATAIKEQQRRGILSADIDPDEEIGAVKEEGPEPGELVDEGGMNGTQTEV